MQATFKPGDTAKMHHHPQHMAYVKKGGRIRITAEDQSNEMDPNRWLSCFPQRRGP